MAIRNKSFIMLYCLIIAVFIIGIAKLFVLRFEAGDVYPAYSTLRSDPLGSKAFYESLDNLNSLTVSRNYKPLSKLHPEQGVTFFFVGIEKHKVTSVHEETRKSITRFVNAGGRLVISFMPEKSYSTKEENKCKTKQEPKKEKPSDMKVKFISLMDHWGMDFAHMEPGTHMAAERTEILQGQILPDTISCHTFLCFDKLDDSWKKIYTCNGYPVIIEKQVGKGSVVFAADTYLLSNEAMLKERHPELLTWLIGQNTRIIFDESHFGIFKSEGIASLARKYHLHWFFLALLLPIGLFIWKNSLYFVPPLDDSSITGNHFHSEKNYTDGLVSLLRRNISQHDILGLCFREWKKSLVSDKKINNDKLEKIKTVIKTEDPRYSKQGDPVRGYQAIHRIVSERKK